MKTLLPLLAFLFLPIQAYAAGVSLSSTQVGTTAVLTATIPPNACSANGMGESKSETISGFRVSVFSLNERGTIVGNLAYVDLSQATVSQLTIAGNSTISFHPDSRENQIANKTTQRSFDFDSPITFQPAESASVTLNNVRISQAGQVKAVFGFKYANGINTPCLHSGWSTINIGQAATTKTLKPTTGTVFTPTASLSRSASTPSPILTPADSPSGQHDPIGIQYQHPLSNLFSGIINFFKTLFIKQ